MRVGDLVKVRVLPGQRLQWQTLMGVITKVCPNTSFDKYSPPWAAVTYEVYCFEAARTYQAFGDHIVVISEAQKKINKPLTFVITCGII